MDAVAQERFLLTHALAAQDELYRQLHSRCAELDLPFLAAMEKLSVEDRQVVTEYIQTLGSSALRLLEIACET